MEAVTVSSISTLMMMITISAILFPCASAANRTVGGSSGWGFSVNDELVFLYTPDHDVIEVRMADFISCQISSHIATYDDGETVILLSQPGTGYFVCGRPCHCDLGLNLQVPVLDQPSRPSGSAQPVNPSSNSTTKQKQGPPQASAAGSDGDRTDDHGSPPFNRCSSLNVIAFASSLLHLGILSRKRARLARTTMEAVTVSSISTLKRTMVMLIIISAILFPCVSAANHTVDGSSSWSFSINDPLVSFYTPDHDEIEVIRADFISCQISSPKATSNGSETVIACYCDMGLKLPGSVHPTKSSSTITELYEFFSTIWAVFYHTITTLMTIYSFLLVYMFIIPWLNLRGHHH